MDKKDAKKYDSNFTAGGILYHEFSVLKDVLQSENFNDLIKIEEEQNVLIGVATTASRIRILREIKRRYNNAPNDFWSQFFCWNECEQKLALFFLCLKSYPLILDIHFEVTVKKFKIGNKLDPFDIQMRMDEIASFDDDVAKWSELTIKRINVQYRKAIKDVGIYDGKLLHKNSKASTPFWNYFKNNNESWFLEACFINTY